MLREAPGPYPALTRSFPTLVSDLLALDAELSEHLVPPEELARYDTELLETLAAAKLTNADLRKVPETAEARRELLGMTLRYREAKAARDLLDFGDQIALSAELALTRPEVGTLLRDEFRVVLLDEYQDTSVAQRLLLSALFGSGPEGDTGHAVTAVGDPCQAIYGWRGASVANLDDFPRHFPHADGTPATRYSLSENRRSGGRLLHLANGLADPLRAMHEGVEALRPAPGAERDGTVRCALLPTHAEEIDWLGDRLAHLVRTGTPPGEIAVLCRTAGDFPASRRRSSPGTSPSRSSGCPDCCTSRRSPTSSPSARSSRTRGPTPPWCGCSPARAGGSAPGTSPSWDAGPASSSTVTRTPTTPTRTTGWRRPSKASTRPR